MRWIYREFFYVPKYGKVREKVMNAHVVVTVAVILISLAAMSLSAYGYFSCNVSSGTNQIRAASFGAKVSVTDTAGQDMEVTAAQNGSKLVTLIPGTYHVSIQPDGTANTGFCIITAQDCDTVYHTQQLENTTRDGFSFQLTAEAEAVLSICPNWGTSSYYAAYSRTGENTEQYILDGEAVTLKLTKPQTPPPDTQPETTESATTEPPATQPAPTVPPETEPPATEPSATDPPATEPLATEPETTEPPATEPPATEPPATEPPATEPPATEPPATEPPATEPPATEPPATEPETTVSPETTPYI